MIKVRVIKEMPNYPIGSIALRNSDRDTILGICIADLIREGWLEVMANDPQNIVRVVKDAYKYQTEFGVVELGDELARKIATAAMKYASEVASKAVVAKYQALHPQAVLIIETLLKEAEGI